MITPNPFVDRPKSTGEGTSPVPNVQQDAATWHEAHEGLVWKSRKTPSGEWVADLVDEAKLKKEEVENLKRVEELSAVSKVPVEEILKDDETSEPEPEDDSELPPTSKSRRKK